MGKKSTKKYYAIKEGRKSNLIVESWTECKELTQGCRSIFKAFITKDEAEEYLRGDTVKVSEEKPMLRSSLNTSKRNKKSVAVINLSLNSSKTLNENDG